MKPSSQPLSRPLPGQSTARHVQVSQCLISFGSNLGDRHDLIAAAADEISRWEIISAEKPLETSRLFETPPIGGPGGQEPFLNAIGAFETTAPAREILDRLQELETRLGRQRRRRWDARSIDLDVVLHGRLVGGATGLVVPHPRYTARQFVLRPACDVVPHFCDPRFGWTMAQISQHLLQGAPSLALVTGSQALRETLCRRLEAEHGIEYRRFSPVQLSLDQSGLDQPGLDQLGLAQPGPNKTGAIAESGEPASTTLPWVTDGLSLPSQRFHSHSESVDGHKTLTPQGNAMPRLLVRIHRSEDNLRWPAPHLMWPSGWQWPEYRLECSDLDWAVSELSSAFDSMRCEVKPVSEDGRWWKK
ncbi:2-amino-4-hydroxy-6-hydroxymethyldihydropteridine diphosphokinase [Roseiconus lacunae]|uniref:2-amino-4-hydroxy-6- hydroxymethyldihydropteridine diphosphokinase n=1 Tax=Roseiconus lacunae TaxID=2605694 RepID=UPI001E5934A0|nr:2-amino-4-hydroxy-6-hydroxymethyldihydropteridine diphosphokinase [Roseiconus lacunae]MCD0463210.1 2-amino-4-hydroxy-6-hydroxymethyldihydropteridine diphosphokinase [Roseiconus lacunae]